MTVRELAAALMALPEEQQSLPVKVCFPAPNMEGELEEVEGKVTTISVFGQPTWLELW